MAKDSKGHGSEKRQGGSVSRPEAPNVSVSGKPWAGGGVRETPPTGWSTPSMGSEVRLPGQKWTTPIESDKKFVNDWQAAKALAAGDHPKSTTPVSAGWNPKPGDRGPSAEGRQWYARLSAVGHPGGMDPAMKWGIKNG